MKNHTPGRRTGARRLARSHDTGGVVNATIHLAADWRDGAHALICPCCGDEYLQHSRVTVYDRDQLWSEAVALELGGESLTMPASMWPQQHAEIAKKREHNAFVDELQDLQGHQLWNPANQVFEERISSKEIMKDILKLKPRDLVGPAIGRKLADAMKRLGWRGPKKIRVDGKSPPERGYWRLILDDDAAAATARGAKKVVRDDDET
jgi:hypothetical protein